jgi:hypothetical protein
MNMSFKTGVVPESWKIGIVVPILKPGKNKEDVESYRPITLLNCMGKLLEKLIQKRLEYIAEKRLHMLDSSQCGFRRGQGTTDILVRLEHEIRNSIKNKMI